MRKIAVLLVLAAALCGGCIGPFAPVPPPPPPEYPTTKPTRHTPATPAAPSAAPATPTAPPATPPAAETMALVNGRPITMARLQEILVHAYGMPIAQHLVGLELALQAVAERGLTVTEEDIQEEHRMTIRHSFKGLGSPAKDEEFLDHILAQKNISRHLWRVIMHRTAALRKLAPKNIQVTEAEIRAEFGQRYGRKAVVRHVQTTTLAEAQKVKELADKGIDFSLLVTKYSTNESRKNGGVLPPIGPETAQVSPAMRQAALAMTKVGEISSPILTGTKFHVLRLEKIVEPKTVKYADEKPKIAAEIRELRVRMFQNKMMKQLILKAKIDFIDPILKAQSERDEKAAAAAKAKKKK